MPVDYNKLSRAQRRQFVYNTFLKLGYKPHQAQGMLAHIIEESGADLNFRAVGDGGKAFGYAQWHPDRRERFKKAFGKDMRNATPEEQLRFIDYELKNYEKSAYNALMRSTTVSDSVRAFAGYERFAGWQDENSSSFRRRFANAGIKPSYKNSKGKTFGIGNDAVRDKMWGQYNLELSNARKNKTGEARVQAEEAVKKKYYDRGWFPHFNAIIARQNANNLFAGREKANAAFRIANNLEKYLKDTNITEKNGKQYITADSSFDASKLSSQERSDIENVLGKKLPANNKINSRHLLTNLQAKMNLFLPKGQEIHLMNSKTGERGKGLAMEGIKSHLGGRTSVREIYIPDFSKGNQGSFGSTSYERKKFAYNSHNDYSFVKHDFLQPNQSWLSPDNVSDYEDVPMVDKSGNIIDAGAEGTAGYAGASPDVYSDNLGTTVNGYPYQKSDREIAVEEERNRLFAERTEMMRNQNIERQKKEDEKAAADADKATLDAANSMFDNIANMEAPEFNLYDPKNYKQNIDWAGYAQSLFGIIAGNELSKQDIPMRDEVVNEGFLNYASELQRLSEIGLRPEEEAYAKRMLTESYSSGLEQISQAANGNRNIVLGNLGRLDYQKQEGLMKIALADANAKNEALYKYGEAMKYINEFDANRDISNNEREYQNKMMNKQTGAQLMSAGWKSLMENIQYQKENKPGSANHMYKSYMMQKMFDVNPDLKDDGTGNTPYTMSWAKKRQEEGLGKYEQAQENQKKYNQLSASNKMAYAKYAEKNGYTGSEDFLNYLYNNKPTGTFDFSKIDEVSQNKNFSILHGGETPKENPTAPENNIPSVESRILNMNTQNQKTSIFDSQKSFAQKYSAVSGDEFFKKKNPFDLNTDNFKLNPFETFDENMFDQNKFDL